MNSNALIDSLAAFAEILPAAVRGIGAEDAKWRPSAKDWSILEVVTHMADEESEDFRRRLELTLRDSGAQWPPIDPEGWAAERKYNDGDLAETVARFAAERRASVEWLRGLDAPDWSKTFTHPKIGPIRAGDLLLSWTAHDVLHLRQIAKRRFQIVERDGGVYKTDYAGSWTL